MSALKSLKQFFKPTDPGRALTTDPFIAIDRESAIKKLRIDERAKINGESNLPDERSTGFDEVESEIIAQITEFATRAHANAQNHLQIYGKRISELALLRELSAITGESRKAIADYRSTIIRREGRLSLAKDAIKESYQELADFKKDHGLRRPAHRGLLPIYAWSTIIVSLVVEALFNTAFLRVNDDLGLVGGFVAAIIVAAVNVGISAMFGRFAFPYLWHKDGDKKALASVGLAVWLVFLLVWNLLAAHFRDAKSDGLAEPEKQALELLINSPFGLTSIYSYGLLAAGFTFAFLSAIAAFKMKDPYPGYGDIYERHEQRCDEYADEIEIALDELEETRNDAIEDATATKANLGAQFRERGLIITNRLGLMTRYQNHLRYLEQMANTLLSHYRSENKRHRVNQPPNHFNETWVLQYTDLPPPPDEPKIDDEVQRAQAALEQAIKQVSDAYDSAIEELEHLDAIKRSLGNG